MSRLLRMDGTGHSQLAEWTGTGTDYEHAAAALRAELEEGYIAVWDHRDGTATHVRELPAEADLVILRKPIAGGYPGGKRRASGPRRCPGAEADRPRPAASLGIAVDRVDRCLDDPVHRRRDRADADRAARRTGGDSQRRACLDHY